MDRITIEGFNFTSDFVASNLQSYPIAQALKKLQEYEDTGFSPDEVEQGKINVGNAVIKLQKEINADSAESEMTAHA